MVGECTPSLARLSDSVEVGGLRRDEVEVGAGCAAGEVGRLRRGT